MARLSGPGPGVVTGPVIGRFRVHAGDGIGLLDDLGDEHVRSVLLNEGFQLEAELTHGPLGQGLQAHPLLRPGHFLSMGGVGEAAELLGELVDLLANLIGCGQGLGPLGLDGGTLISRLLDAGSGRLGGGALFPLTARGSSQGVGTPSAGALALLGRAQRQSGVGLGAAGLARSLCRPLPLLSGALQRALKMVGAMTSYVAHHITESLARDLLPATRLLQRGVGRGLRLCCGGGLGLGLLVSGAELENRGGPTPRSGDPAGSQDVATASGHDGVGQRCTQGPSGLDILRDPAVLEQPVQDPPEAPVLLPRDTHELAGHQHAVDGGRRRLVIGVMLDAHRRLTGQNQPYGPHVLAASALQPSQGGPGVDGEPGLSEHPQEGGDGVLPAALDADVLRQRTEEALDPGLEQCGRPVLAAQGHGQGVTSGSPGGPVGGRLPAGVGGSGDGLASLGQTAGRLPPFELLGVGAVARGGR